MSQDRLTRFCLGVDLLLISPYRCWRTSARSLGRRPIICEQIERSWRPSPR